MYLHYTNKTSVILIFIFFFRYEKAELDEMQDELEDLRDCGIGSCRPAFVQPLANIKVYILFSLFAKYTTNAIKLLHIFHLDSNFWTNHFLFISGFRLFVVSIGNLTTSIIFGLLKFCDNHDRETLRNPEFYIGYHCFHVRDW